jgi:conjugative relaxase-like TrwC/TraI family protein
MISNSIITNPGGAAGYYSDVQKAAEYYAGKDEVTPSAWDGKAAAALGLRGEVNARDLTAVLEGKAFDKSAGGDITARQLGRVRIDKETGERKIEHRAGYDFTISAPKSVSLEALVHNKTEALEAHRAAEREAFKYLEQHAAQTRLKSGEYSAIDGLLAAKYEHVASREGDPQLHTHVIIANVTTLTANDGSMRSASLSSEKLYEHRAAADAIYHQTLARELQKAGYTVNVNSKGHVEIDGYSRAQLNAMSTRAKQIEDALAERGQTRDTATAQEKQVAALASRRDKTLPETREAHQAHWQARADAAGIKPAERGEAQHAQQHRDAAADAARAAVDQAKAHLTEREFVAREAALYKEAARFATGSAASREAIEREIAAQVAAGELIRDGDRYTTRDALAAEKDMAARLDAGRDAHTAVMSDERFKAALTAFEARKGFALSPEQRAAARSILTSRDQYSGVQGLAGTGKTTMLEFVREAAQAQGWQVRGHSNGAEQAATMQKESGIESTTTARHLIAAKQELKQTGIASAPKKELRIMDEASMAGQKSFNDVLRTSGEAGAKTVFLGDSKQHQSVEAGRAFERAQQNMHVSVLGQASIRRQTTAHMQNAVSEIIANRHREALTGLKSVEIADARQALAPGATKQQTRDALRGDNAAVIARIAKDYAAKTPEQRDATLVLTSTNADRKALNDAIRDELKVAGQLSAADANARTLQKVDITKTEAAHARNYEAGQVLEVIRGRGRAASTDRYTVENVDSTRNVIVARNEATGKTARINPQAPGQQLRAYEAQERQFQPGDRIRFTENGKDAAGEKVLNGRAGVIEKIDGDRATIKTTNGDTRTVDLRAAKIEHNYVMTSYASQGRTVDQVLIHHNTEAGGHGMRESYVNVTRAKKDAVMYTQNAEKALRQVGVNTSKTSAHDLQQPGPGPRPPQPPGPPQEPREPGQQPATPRQPGAPATPTTPTPRQPQPPAPTPTPREPRSGGYERSWGR